jgi:hypothetical protein
VDDGIEDSHVGPTQNLAENGDVNPMGDSRQIVTTGSTVASNVPNRFFLTLSLMNGGRKKKWGFAPVAVEEPSKTSPKVERVGGLDSEGDSTWRMSVTSVQLASKNTPKKAKNVRRIQRLLKKGGAQVVRHPAGRLSQNGRFRLTKEINQIRCI